MFVFSVRPRRQDHRMDKAFLEECLANGMSLPKIGELTSRPPGSVGYWVRRHGLVANGADQFSRKGPLDRDRLEALVVAGLSVKEITAAMGVDPARVRYWIKKYELGPSSRGVRASAVRGAREAGLKEIELVCPKHGLTPFWVGKTAVRCRRCNSTGVAKRRRKVKQVLIEEAGGCCKICGFDSSPVALEFHHLDPSAKAFGLSQAGITRAIELSRTEAAKCVLLCANCHAQVEAGVLDLAVE